MRVPFRVSDAGVETIYDDRIAPLLQKLGLTELTRASHIDPIPPPRWWEYLRYGGTSGGRRLLYDRWRLQGHFGIFWRGRLQRLLGPCTLLDEEGRPFVTKRDAEAAELRLLTRMYFRQQTQV